MLSAVKDKLPGRNRKVVALDWDAKTLKAVEAVINAGGLRVQRVISVQIPGDVKCNEPDSFGAFIKGVLHEKRFGTHQALMAVPRDKVILINLRVPQAPVGDLSNMVKLQASRELPFSVEEAVMDFAGSQANDAPEFLDLTVGAIQREAMGFFTQLAQKAGLHLVRLGLRPNSGLVSITRGLQPFSDDRILFVDIGAQTTEISIFRWGRLTFSRAVSINIDTDAGSEPARRSLLMEVLRTVEAYRAQDPNKLDQVIVAGDSGVEGWLVESLRGRFQAPASIYDPTWTVSIEKDRAQQMAGFCAVLGLLTGQAVPELGRFDFVNPKHPADLKAIRRKQVTIGACVAVVALLAIWAASNTYIGSLSAEKKQLEVQIADLQKKIKEGKQISSRIESVQKWTDQEIVWVDLLKTLAEQMPGNVDGYATKLQAKGQNRQVDLGLRVASMTLPNDLCSRLAVLEGVTPEIRNTTQGSGKYPFTSDLIVRIDPPAKPGTSKDKAKTKAAQSQPAPTTRQIVERPQR